ncbi:CGNR zinc finger domain-containing protein [Saccharothrix violaceirubra]|uniref:Putative RNA-binding Zn ribbon-like protein n=1 Tax=Saccharothrix violaceirubra TaxID=413306 RepID=A0A7W7WV62_9PSEU|nr:CGNR zinc finger domain-containing protein [Saccharothrix violaceirubra]MBB4964756.1 putative RNA-binding Zn ribbon-like protein [Saccharothrix violaceirubra]
MSTDRNRSAPADPRPLTGEPPALDLLNTRWRGASGLEDLLSDLHGLAIWLSSAGLDSRAEADQDTLDALLRTREALTSAVTSPVDATALNDVLAKGRLRLSLVAGVPTEEIDLDDPAWLPGWLAARDYLDLVTRGADRIKPCANTNCVLHFFDTSKNGSRRWCSMAGCGNRAKAGRHYARTRTRAT